MLRGLRACPALPLARILHNDLAQRPVVSTRPILLEVLCIAHDAFVGAEPYEEDVHRTKSNAMCSTPSAIGGNLVAAPG